MLCCISMDTVQAGGRAGGRGDCDGATAAMAGGRAWSGGRSGV